mmetsp:Transcript_784/g.673  ORF Transcript_784/g.673 Transcript_784/m.673 type:complete len:93 (+) Transcript_784:1-279(+)
MTVWIENELIVWSEHSIQTTKVFDINSNDKNSKDSKEKKKDSVLLYDFTSMIMLGISYILIALILISCQNRAISQRKQLQQNEDDDIEHQDL